MGLKLKLLGQMECGAADGTTFKLSTRKAEVLLAYLALAQGVRQPRERLTNLLWSDRSEDQARNSLRQTLSVIKKKLESINPALLEIERTTVRLDTNLLQVDALEFEALCTESDKHSLSKAFALYQGEFLEGITVRDSVSQDWLANTRDRFGRQLIEMLIGLGEFQLTDKDFKATIESAEFLVNHDPLQETGWRLLMRAHQANDDRNHALQAYKRCHDGLATELGVEPEEETNQLRDLIRDGKTSPTLNKTTDSPSQNITKSNSPDNSHNIAVLPFDNLSGDPDQEYFSDGIAESIILNLSLFPGLLVKSRNSSFAFKEQIKGLGEISKELNVDYVVEGSIRKASDRIRITVQLIEVNTGNHIWGKRYDADMENLFDLEEQLSRTIAATVTGQIESNLQGIAIKKGAVHQQSYDLLLSGIFHCNQYSRPNMLIAIEKLNLCLQQDPDNIRAHSTLFNCHSVNAIERWVSNVEESFSLAGKHAKKAMSISPEMGFAQNAYSEYLTFCRRYGEALKHVNKSLEINPNDPETLRVKAFTLAMMSEFELAFELVELSCQLDPYNPCPDCYLIETLVFSGRYIQALEVLSKSNNAMGYIQIYNIVSHIKLDQLDQARQALKKFLRESYETIIPMPKTVEDWLLYTKANSPFQDEKLNQEIINCLILAGLEDEPDQSPTIEDSDQRPRILVLPFGNLSGDKEQEYFGDGITKSVILNLSSFNGLNVKSRQASFAFKDSSLGIDEIAKELDVQYIIDGSIRKHGDQVRITVQLSDTQGGNQIWGKRFDTPLADLFKLEEELVQTIAGTISVKIDREIKTSSVRKPTKDIRSYDYLMRAWYHADRFTLKDSLIALDLLNRCLETNPSNVEAHTLIAGINYVLLYENWAEDRKQTKATAKRHILKALEIDPNHALAHAVETYGFLFEKDFKTALFHADKAIELNPALPDGYSTKAYILSIQGRMEQAVEIAKFSMQIDPYHYYIGWNTGLVYSRAGLFEQAIETFQSIPMLPTNLLAETAACQIALGDEVKARATMKQYHQLAREEMPNFPSTVEAWRSLWYENEPFESDSDFDIYFNRLLDAGLCNEIIDSTVTIPSIAVLPFENMSNDPEQAYFSDGITSDIISSLSRLRNMRVVARQSVLSYKNRETPIAKIAEQQQVRYLLDGSIRKNGNRVRVNVQLIDSHTGENCWGESYDRNLDDIFAVQDEITQNITIAMRVQLIDGEGARDRSMGTQNIKAWQLITKAYDLSDSYIKSNIFEARRLAEAALELDSDYCLAWVALGWTYWQEAYCAWGKSIDESLNQAEIAIQKAMDIDSDSAEVLILSGSTHTMRNRPEKAIIDCQRAAIIAPNNAEIQALAGFAFDYNGQYEQAQVYLDASLRLSPIYPNWYMIVSGEIALHSGAIEKAIEDFQLGIDLEPESTLVRYYLIDALITAGNLTKAMKVAQEIKALDPTFGIAGFIRACSHDETKRCQFQSNLEKVGFKI